MERTAKYFRKRDAILSCLRQTDEHPSAEWIHTRLKAEYSDISLGTVYRNLALFKEQGLVVSLGTVGGVERFDAHTAPHAHLICTNCGRITDLPEIAVPEALKGAAQRISGGRIDGCRLNFTGVCGECLKPIGKEEIP